VAGKNTIIYIDPPSGWRYGFPKPAPKNLREFENHDLNNWLMENGYPREEVEIWTNSPKYGSVPCRVFEREIKKEVNE